MLAHPLPDQIQLRLDLTMEEECEKDSLRTEKFRIRKIIIRNISIVSAISMTNALNSSLTIFTASGYIASVITFLFLVTYSTISFKAVRFTSFHFKSERGSDSKSNSTQHWRNFWMKSSSLSFPCCVSRIKRKLKNI